MAKNEFRIAKEKIKKIQLYINSGKKTLETVMKETGADYGINGTLYNSDWTPCENNKIDGKVISSAPWNTYGLAWENGPDLNICWIPANTYKNNYFSGLRLVDSLRLLNFELSYGSELGGTRGRTAIGLTPTEMIIYSCSDGSDALTLEKLQAKMWDYGCTMGAIAMDGGQSVMAMSKDGSVNIVNSNRTAVQNYILFWIDEDADKEPEETEETVSQELTIIQKPCTKNKCYQYNTKKTKKKFMQHSTGTPGASAQNIFDAWNKSTATACVEFVIDDTGVYQLLPLGIKSWHAGTGTSGSSANNTHIACEICEPQETRLLAACWAPLYRNGPNNTTWAVKRLQQELTAWGYDPKGVDGSFGPGCQAAVKQFQTDNGLSIDGSCGPATLAKLQTRPGSYLKYSAKNNEKYFNTVYNYAVKLAAYIMKLYGTEPTYANNNLISHAEGYKLGIASNHADVGHWFPEHGKTMDDFRADVKACMNGTYKDLGSTTTTTPSEPEVEEPETPTTPTTPEEPVKTYTHAENVDELVKAGIISSGDYWKGNSYSASNVQALIKKTADYLRNE